MIRFNSKELVTIPGREVNEDLAYVDNNAAYIMDGATALTKTDNEWDTPSNFVKVVSSKLRTLIQDKSKTLGCCVNEALEYTKTVGEFKSSASILVIRPGKELEVYSLGDCCIMLKYRNGNIKVIHDSRVSNLDSMVLDRMQEIATEKGISIKNTRDMDEIQRMLKENRELGTLGGRYSVLRQDKNAVSKGILYNVNTVGLEYVLLATDGFMEFEKSEEFTREQIISDCEHFGLEEVTKKIVQTVLEDKDWNTFPRFKELDDTTAIFIKCESK